MRLFQLCISLFTLGCAFAKPPAGTCPWPASQLSVLHDSIRFDHVEFSDLSEEVPMRRLHSHDLPRNIQNVWRGPNTCTGQYCVWSSQVSTGEALSIVTTQANSRTIQNRTMSSSTVYRSPLFRTIDIPGKGVGMVAIETIRRGDRIVTAQPRVIVHMNLLDEIGLEDQHRLLEAAAAELPPTKRQQFLAQAGALGGHRIRDIMFTNSFGMNLGGQDGHHLGNFPELSRFNHDCRPNVAHYIDESLTHHTHAIRDILPGEELTISYLDSFRAREVRQARTHSSWGFACTCSHCSLPVEEANASDARLYSIFKVENQLTDLGDKKATPEMIEQLLNLYKEERLELGVADVYTIASLNYNTFGMPDMARKYASLSIEQGLLEHGPDAPDIEAMRLILADAEKHWTYNRRPYQGK